MRSWDALNRRIVQCELCPRLRDHCRCVAQTKRKSFADDDYWARPLPNFGDPQGRLVIVGLAPAAHGANRTGRMFTGDRSGQWLFRALHKAGFANRAESESRDDGLELIDCAITAVCHCAPPDNKPTLEEQANCQSWLSATIELLPAKVFLALGQIAWNACVAEARRRAWLQGPRPKFAHAAQVKLNGERWLLGSYHPSQQNTFTGRLTAPMLDAVFSTARQILTDAETPRRRKPYSRTCSK
jgi:uracil-DNA glycosylase family 4